MKKLVNLVLCVGMALCMVSFAMAEETIQKPANFPRKEIKVIVPYAPGGAFDLAVRNLQPILKEKYDVNIIVENVEGGSGAVGIMQCIASKADGYTLALAGRNWVSNIANGVVDIQLDQIDYLCGVTADTLALVVAANSPYETVDDFCQAALKNPGTMTIGSPALNNGNHACAVMLGKAYGNKDLFNTVPLSGSSRVMAEIIGGGLDGGSVKIADSVTQIKNGDVKVLMVFDKNRAVLAPDAPTIEECGYAYWPYGGNEFNCNAIIAPVGLDSEIREYLVSVFAAAVKDEAFVTYCDNAGAVTDPVIGQELKAQIANLYETFLTWQDVVFN